MDYLIRKVVRRGHDHDTYCQDAVFHHEADGFICIAVMDGCSGGINSHFASELIAKLLRKSVNRVLNYRMTEEPIILSDIGEKIIREVFLELLSVKINLELQDLELVSTLVFSIIDTRKNDAYCIISGDGMIFVNGKSYKKVSENNMPDYMAYYLHTDKPGMLDSLMKFHIENVNDLSVCSDGVDSFLTLNGVKLDENYIYEKLLTGDFLQKSDAMLARRINLLEKNENLRHFDDVSIVRYIKLNEM